MSHLCGVLLALGFQGGRGEARSWWIFKAPPLLGLHTTVTQHGRHGTHFPRGKPLMLPERMRVGFLKSFLRVWGMTHANGNSSPATAGRDLKLLAIQKDGVARLVHSEALWRGSRWSGVRTELQRLAAFKKHACPHLYHEENNNETSKAESP